jgi:hypothetical protein
VGTCFRLEVGRPGPRTHDVWPPVRGCQAASPLSHFVRVSGTHFWLGLNRRGGYVHNGSTYSGGTCSGAVHAVAVHTMAIHTVAAHTVAVHTNGQKTASTKDKRVNGTASTSGGDLQTVTRAIMMQSDKSGVSCFQTCRQCHKTTIWSVVYYNRKESDQSRTTRNTEHYQI